MFVCKVDIAIVDSPAASAVAYASPERLRVAFFLPN